MKSLNRVVMDNVSDGGARLVTGCARIPKWWEEQKTSTDAKFVETRGYISRILELLTKKGEESSSNTPEAHQNNMA
ncbi:hypothetical protein GOBAR_DD31035 [Gossypium barbadense]|nr:hypothetical protein GOBAR_DD31035 [Gossypium barbadense]